jgi:hypothetical protein
LKFGELPPGSSLRGNGALEKNWVAKCGESARGFAELRHQALFEVGHGFLLRGVEIEPTPCKDGGKKTL